MAMQTLNNGESFLNIRTKINGNFSELYDTQAGVVDVVRYATGGTGTELDPWTGWDTEVTWQSFTRYRFRAGWYALATSPNFAYDGISIEGDPGTFWLHTGTGPALLMDAGADQDSNWIMRPMVSNIQIRGKVTQLTGTLNFSTASTTVTGTGTQFTSQVSVGDAISYLPGTGSAYSMVVTAIASNTSLTIDKVPLATRNASEGYVCKSKYGFFVRGTRFGQFDNCSAKDIVESGFYSEAAVSNFLRNFRVSWHDPSRLAWYRCIPKYGIVAATRGAANHSTCWSIENCVVEGAIEKCIWIKFGCYHNTVINGASELGYGVGLQIDGEKNYAFNHNCEQNGSHQLLVTGTRNLLASVSCMGTQARIEGGFNTLLGVVSLGGLEIAASAAGTRLINAAYYTLTDQGTQTIYDALDLGSNRRAYIGVLKPVVTTNPVNCNLGNELVIQLDDTTTTVTIQTPTNAVDLDEIQFIVYNVSASATRTISWSAGFVAAAGVTLPTNVAPGAGGIISAKAVYMAVFNKWVVLSVGN